MLAAIRTFLVATAIILATAHGADAQGKKSKLAQAFDPEMISADLAYFEQVTGPARSTYGNTKTYKVDGCEVTATISDGSVRSLRVDLNHKCTINLNTFLPNFQSKFPALDAMTFGKFDAVSGGNGQFMADCLTGCGNAADPVVYEHWYGSRANLMLEVMLEVVLDGIPAINAAHKWQAAMEKSEGENWVSATKFNCDRTKYDHIAHQAFRDVKISAITIGYDIETPRCEISDKEKIPLSPHPWLEQLSPEEQRAALVMFQIALGEKVQKVINSAKSRDDEMWGLKIFACGHSFAAQSSTKNKDQRQALIEIAMATRDNIAGYGSIEARKNNLKKAELMGQKIADSISNDAARKIKIKYADELKKFNTDLIVAAMGCASSKRVSK